jgi:hypothetical protein
MNEQIKNLAIKSGLLFQRENLSYEEKKFAELIIRECAEACEKNSYLALNAWQRAKQIREHFGVEE